MAAGIGTTRATMAAGDQRQRPMAVDLKSKRGKTFLTTDEHWSVFLNVAQRYGWQPAGTLAPPSWPRGEVWSGQYGTRDGQGVGDEDARALAMALYAAARDDGVARALRDVISQVELAAERGGSRPPPGGPMRPGDFYEEFSPLLLLLYDGGFSIN